MSITVRMGSAICAKEATIPQIRILSPTGTLARERVNTINEGKVLKMIGIIV